MTKFSRTHSEIWRDGSTHSDMVAANTVKHANTAITVHDGHARGPISSWQDSGVRLLLLLGQRLKREQVIGPPEPSVVGPDQFQSRAGVPGSGRHPHGVLGKLFPTSPRPGPPCCTTSR